MARETTTSGDLVLLVATLAVLGIVTSAYLTWQWYEAANRTWCDVDPFFSCTKVRESPFSAVAGIPTALVGVVGFGILLVLAASALRGIDRMGPLTTMGWLWIFASLGAAIGIGLTLIEIFVIQALCLLCVIGFGIDLGILAVVFVLRRGGLEA